MSSTPTRAPARAAAQVAHTLSLILLLGLAGAAVHPVADTQVGHVAAGAVLSLKGTASGLFPGARKPLTVTVTNPHRFAIRVTRVRVRVQADSLRPDCDPEAYVRVSALPKPFTVPRRSRGRVRLRMTMLSAAPDACQAVQFPLALSATARRT